MKYRFILLSLVVLFVSSCAISTISADFRIGKTTMISDYKVFQTMDGTFGLASSQRYDMIVAIKSSSQFFPIYDGEIISGLVVMTDTYTYESIINEETGRTRTRTVPVVVPYKEYSSRKD